MAEVALKMVRDSLNAFMEKDHERAKAILEEDDVIDRINDQVYESLQKMLGENPEKIRVGLSLIMISHNLERVADLATNIAEDVIYMTEAKMVRHHPEKL